jgi:DNA polymerase
MAAIYGMELPESTINDLVAAWRKAHPRTKAFWYDCERAAKDAIRTPNKTFVAGKLKFRFDGSWLRMMLPSGRYLCYPNAGLNEAGSLYYEGINQYTRKWERLDTYGGKLVENATQAAARDVLAYGMRKAEEAGYSIVLHVHDELITEVPDDPAFTHEGLAAIMAHGPQWSVGLPLAAAGYETTRYRKD